MTKDEINFVTEFVQKTLNVPATEAASLLFDVKEDGSGELKGTALPTLLEKDKTRVQAFKDESTQAHDKGYKKAQGEALVKFESNLKEKYGISSEKQGIELIEFLVTEKIKASGTGEQDEEKIKRSKLYLDTVDKLTKEKNEAVAQESKKYEDLQKTIQKESTFKTVSETVLDYINKELMPILPEGKTPDGKSKAEIQVQKFIKDFATEFEIEVKEGKILLSKEGKLLEDPHGRHLDIKDVVKAKASELWDFKEGEARNSAGNKHDDPGNGGQGGDKGYKGPRPTNQDEYLKFIGEAKDEATKIEITKVWNETKPKS